MKFCRLTTVALFTMAMSVANANAGQALYEERYSVNEDNSSVTEISSREAESQITSRNRLHVIR
ncbi:MAG: hypothetical protein CMI08_09610 [Oceanospirillaceae bacterium]|uniref:hypothetical protein n=1 Tax=unclassified Thalassolituus TaxID=2624967 RepID=UPI000C4235D7|nr:MULTISPECIES: hypothetical protein [unclassified Thalassolituus]MAS24060.1 hypothetical protein [Oceanospirillaceae bacterium]MAX98718.1 hypothetical protein [Oceanospirillaceae bacterium]MAX99444.1 hypothetical protein [Oceanospirillaceae bacterium]MBL33584.1 hypothetical protein [Oceanospirillaceae bacterium]MBS53121.1 hypothetical protein [Oceanospirillaceae bacterium]|tara:strand:+ start:2581 stop:2772 length:192 start_codon:yes stop_codon:yes gene_type:complete